MKKFEPYFPYRVKVIVLAIIYFLAAKFGLGFFEPVSGFATLVWPPTGIALAALLLFGRDLWPGVLLGAFFANLTTGAPLLVAVGMGMGNALEALAGAYLLRRAGFSPSLGRLSDVFALIAFAAVASTLVSATLGVSSLLLGSVITAAAYGATWRAWWIGDVLGDLVIAPLILVWTKGAVPGRVSPKKIVEAIGLAAFFGVIALVIFGGGAPEFVRPVLSYVLFLPLIWASLSFGVRGAALAVFSLSVVAIGNTVAGQGPFAGSSLSEALIQLQLFIGLGAGTALIIAALMTERKEAGAQLASLNRNLEKQVVERTGELRRSEEQYRMFVDLAPDIILTVSREGALEAINPAWERILGFDRGEWIGKEFEAVIHPDDLLRMRSFVKNFFKGGASAPIAAKFKVKKAGSKLMEVAARAIEKEGGVRGLVVLCRDVTEREKMQSRSAEYTRELEREVAARTAELQQKVDDLEKLNKVLVGRELKMAELKKENDMLKGGRGA